MVCKVCGTTNLLMEKVALLVSGCWIKGTVFTTGVVSGAQATVL